MADMLRDLEGGDQGQDPEHLLLWSHCNAAIATIKWLTGCTGPLVQVQCGLRQDQGYAIPHRRFSRELYHWTWISASELATDPNEVLRLLNCISSLDRSYMWLRSVLPSSLPRHTVTADASSVHSDGGALLVFTWLRTVSLFGHFSIHCAQFPYCGQD